MSEWLAQLNAGQMIGLVAVIGGVSIAIVSIVSAAWVRVRRAEHQANLAEAEAVLKQQMLEKGMSADDIERVLAAGITKKEAAEEPVA